MFQSQVQLVLMMATILCQNVCFTSGCNGPIFKNSQSFKHYSKLMKINTGYSGEVRPTLSEEEASESPENLKLAIDELYRQLLCGFTFNLLHYMNLLGNLFSANGENELAKLIESGDYTNVLINSNCTATLNVLYHFGKADMMGPIWLVYMFVKYLKYIEKGQILSRRTNILNEHQTIHVQLTHMHNEQKCLIQNRYNDQFDKSEYFDHLVALNSNPTETVGFITSLKNSMDKMYYIIFYTMDINPGCQRYFSSRHLRFETIWFKKDLMRHLFVDFAEMTEWENTSARIKTVYQNRQFDSVRELIKNVSKFQSLFINLVKYIVLLNVWKHLTFINLSLPQIDNDEQPRSICPPWYNNNLIIKQITLYNSLIAKYVNKTIDKCNLKDDIKLALVTGLLKMPAIVFTDVQFNKNNIELLLKYLDEIYSQTFRVFGCETKLIRSSSFVATQYIEDRWKILNEINDTYNLKMGPFYQYMMVKYASLFESVLGNDLFYSLMTFVYFARLVEGYVCYKVEFDVIRSYIDFSDEFLNSHL